MDLELKTEVKDDILQDWTDKAKNGSEEHQFKLGNHYLQLAELGIDTAHNAQNAVLWLLAASKQGNEPATDKLRHCVQANIGMCPENKAEVTWCLNTSASEKKIRSSARTLFHKINTLQKSVLTTEEYTELISRLPICTDREKQLLLAAGRKIGHIISENDFVKIVSKKIHGTITLTASELDETTAAYNSAGLLQKVMLYPRQTAVLVLDRGLEYASKEGMSLLLSLLPTNQLYLLTLMFLYSCLSPSMLLLVIPLFVFAISLLVLVISTLQMFYKRRKETDAITLASMLQQQFSTDIDLDSTQSQYSWNSLTPYLVFFTTLPLMVVSFSLTNKSYLPCSELFVLSCVMTGLCFLGISDSHDFLTLLALASHACALLPALVAGLPRLPVFTSSLEAVTYPFWSWHLGMGVSFHLSLPSVVHLFIPVIFVCMAIRESWSGLHRLLVPHLVCYFWFSMATTISPLITGIGLVRATLGYLLLPLFIPLSAFFTLIGVPYLIYKIVQIDIVGKLVVTVLLLLVPVILTQTKVIFGKKDDKKAVAVPMLRRLVLIICSVAGLISLFYVRIPTGAGKKSVFLSWDDYKSLCLPEDKLWAPYQLHCHDFLGVPVQWTGTLQQIKVTKIENNAESFIKMLPGFVSKPLSCLYGENIPPCDELIQSGPELRRCQLLNPDGQRCHLNKLNRVFLAMTVTIETHTLNLEAGSFLNDSELLTLAPGDQLLFNATLTTVGNPIPGLKLKSVHCPSRNLIIRDLHLEDDWSLDSLFHGFSHAIGGLIHFCFFPVLEYSSA